MSDQISIKANGTTLRFNVDATAQESLIDEINAGNKVGPMNNFLIRTVDESSKEDLMPFLKVPAFVMRIGEKVIEESTPALKLTLGE